MATSSPSSLPPAGTGTRTSIHRGWLLPGILALLAAALFLRSVNLGTRTLSEREAQAYQDARLGGYTIDFSSGPAVDDPPARHITASGILAAAAAEIMGRGRPTDPVPLRIGDVLFGTLASLLIVLWLLSAAPHEPLTALAGGAFAAVQLASVHNSRLGTGVTMGATLWLAALLAARWVQLRASERQTIKLACGALLVGFLSGLGVLLDPATAPLGWLLGATALGLFTTDTTGAVRQPWASKRVWAMVLAAAVPLVLGALLDPLGPAPATLGARNQLMAVGPPLLVLIPLGLAGAFTRDMGWLVWLAVWGHGAPQVLVGASSPMSSPESVALPLFFQCMLAAEGLALLWGLARHWLARRAVDLVALAALAWMGLWTWIILHPDAPDSILW